MTQKRLEQELGVKINLRGKGIRKRSDLPYHPDDDLEQHVWLMAFTRLACPPHLCAAVLHTY